MSMIIVAQEEQLVNSTADRIAGHLWPTFSNPAKLSDGDGGQRADRLAGAGWSAPLAKAVVGAGGRYYNQCRL